MVEPAFPDCSSIGIPERLHKEDRENDQVFDLAENLFYRIDPSDISGGEVRTTAFKYDHMSVNRSKYSEAGDVLFSIRDIQTVENPHFKVKGFIVYTVEVGPCRDLRFDRESANEKVEYTLNIEHDSECCMYPHSVLVVKENDLEKKNFSTGLKAQIREEYRRLFQNLSSVS